MVKPRIAVMTVDAVTTNDNDVAVRFGTQAVIVPAPLAIHITNRKATGRAHHAGIGSTTPSPWLFPGHLPGRPITALRLGQRLSVFGIDARAARRAAQTQLAGEVPAVVLAEMLGIAIATAVDWVHAAGGDWANYAAITATDADPAEKLTRCNPSSQNTGHSTGLEHRSPPVSTPASRSATSRSPPATPTPARQRSTIDAARTSTATPPMSWSPPWPAA
jgi:hypothetical protein